MASTRTQRRQAATPRRGRPVRQAQPGRRFTRNAPASTRTAMQRRRRQPDQGRGEKLMSLVRGALPGGSGTKRKGSAIPVVGGLLGGKSSARGGRRRKPALLGVLGAGAAGAAVAAKRRKGSATRRATETHPVPESPTASSPPPSTDSPAKGSAD